MAGGLNPGDSDNAKAQAYTSMQMKMPTACCGRRGFDHDDAVTAPRPGAQNAIRCWRLFRFDRIEAGLSIFGSTRFLATRTGPRVA
jgi:hypothetical protein